MIMMKIVHACYPVLYLMKSQLAIARAATLAILFVFLSYQIVTVHFNEPNPPPPPPKKSLHALPGALAGTS